MEVCNNIGMGMTRAYESREITSKKFELVRTLIAKRYSVVQACNLAEIHPQTYYSKLKKEKTRPGDTEAGELVNPEAGINTSTQDDTTASKTSKTEDEN